MGGNWWRARQPRAAATTAAALLATAGVCVFVDGLVMVATGRGAPLGLTGERLSSTLAVIVIPAASVLIAWWTRRRAASAGWQVGLPAAVAAVVAINATNWATNDATAGTQFFVLLPVIYAAYHLRRVAAGLVTLLALVLQSALILSLLPFSNAVHDVLFIWILLTTISVLVGRWRDAQEATLAELRHQARVDALTGLWTRVVLEEAAAREQQGSSLILVDLDRLKQINDTHGHPVGDRVISGVAEVLKSHIRTQDVLCRIGGDELAVYMPDCPDAVARERAAVFVEAVASASFTVGEERLPVGISVGVAHADEETRRSLHHLYAAADLCLYQAKVAGRGRVGTVSS